MVQVNLFVWLGVLAACGLLATTAVQAQLERGYFTSYLDHFTPDDERVEIQMEYVTNRQHVSATSDGPIFIQIQEGDRSTDELLTDGLMFDIAADQNASLVTFDLRFFHRNSLTNSASTENLRLLTVDQILHDIRALIEHLRHINAANSTVPPVILFGRGLGATLATWSQRQFPRLVTGVWSSSGRQLSAVHTDQPVEYFASIVEQLGGPACRERLADAFQSMEMYMAWEAEQHVQFFYGLCTSADRRYAGETSAVFAGITQLIMDQINREHTAAIEGLCAHLNAVEEFELHGNFVALGEWIQAHTPTTTSDCLDTSFLQRVRANQLIDWAQVRRHSWDSNSSILVEPHRSRPALWLACTQLGGALTTQALHNSTFGNQVGQDLFYGHCAGAFGAPGASDAFDYGRLTDAIDDLWWRMSTVAEGVDERVVFTNGQLDAWFWYGQQWVEHDGQVVINIPNYGASADLMSASESDSAELTAAKQRIRELIVSWIAVQ